MVLASQLYALLHNVVVLVVYHVKPKFLEKIEKCYLLSAVCNSCRTSKIPCPVLHRNLLDTMGQYFYGSQDNRVRIEREFANLKNKILGYF